MHRFSLFFKIVSGSKPSLSEGLPLQPLTTSFPSDGPFEAPGITFQKYYTSGDEHACLYHALFGTAGKDSNGINALTAQFDVPSFRKEVSRKVSETLKDTSAKFHGQAVTAYLCRMMSLLECDFLEESAAEDSIFQGLKIKLNELGLSALIEEVSLDQKTPVDLDHFLLQGTVIDAFTDIVISNPTYDHTLLDTALVVAALELPVYAYYFHGTGEDSLTGTNLLFDFSRMSHEADMVLDRHPDIQNSINSSLEKGNISPQYFLYLAANNHFIRLSDSGFPQPVPIPAGLQVKPKQQPLTRPPSLRPSQHITLSNLDYRPLSPDDDDDDDDGSSNGSIKIFGVDDDDDDVNYRTEYTPEFTEPALSREDKQAVLLNWHERNSGITPDTDEDTMRLLIASSSVPEGITIEDIVSYLQEKNTGQAGIVEQRPCVPIDLDESTKQAPNPAGKRHQRTQSCSTMEAFVQADQHQHKADPNAIPREAPNIPMGQPIQPCKSMLEGSSTLSVTRDSDQKFTKLSESSKKEIAKELSGLGKDQKLKKLPELLAMFDIGTTGTSICEQILGKLVTQGFLSSEYS